MPEDPNLIHCCPIAFTAMIEMFCNLYWPIWQRLATWGCLAVKMQLVRLRQLIFLFCLNLDLKNCFCSSNCIGKNCLNTGITICEVKWALESITMNKGSGGDGIPVELFKILKNDAVKVLHSICQQIWKAQQWPQDWERSVFIPIPQNGSAKECSNYCTMALISHTSKVMLKIL